MERQACRSRLRLDKLVARAVHRDAAELLVDRRQQGLASRDDPVRVATQAFRQVLQDGRMPGRLVLLTTRATATFPDVEFRPDDILLLGRESAGVPDEVHDEIDRMAGLRLRIPLQKGARSLNVALAASMVLSEALRQTSGYAPLT